MTETRYDFSSHARSALDDPQIRANFRRAMDGLMSKRSAAFPDADELSRLRDLGAAIRSRTLAKLPDLLEQLESNCRANGIQVHWAETTEQANTIVLEIAQQHDAKRVIKGKSMVSEEMELNDFLEGHGIECIESDLGEYIVQLAGEKPSHIIMPAIHKNTQQIAHLFKEKIREAEYTEDVDELTGLARRVLRRKFYEADIGISGVNFAVAETGTLCLIENEGNGRLSTTTPPVHIAVTGIEKVVENLEDVPPLLSLLTRSATGQHITTYVNMISSPRKAGEKDGPREVHLVLLDNGRSRIHAEKQLAETLRCIRCGACMNHCPVYRRIGGHAYGAVYPGPIGAVVTPQIDGLARYGELPSASTLCGACGEVCPVQIPLPKLLNTLRREGANSRSDSQVKGKGSQRSFIEVVTWWGWQWTHRSTLRYRWMSRLLGLFAKGLPRVGPLKAWTSVRTAPRPAQKSLHQLAQEKGIENE